MFAFNKEGIYRSDDRGSSWRKLPFAGARTRDLALSNAWPYDPVLVAAVDARFQGIVAERRKLTAEKVHELAGGRVYTGDEAIANGLADRLGDLPAAVARARELAGITEVLPLERLPRSGGLAARLGLAKPTPPA